MPAARIEQFLIASGWHNATRQRIAGDASNRKYDRLTNTQGQSMILMDAPPDSGEDIRPFVRIATHLRAVGLSAPEIYHQDPENGLLLIEDFGDALFADLMQAEPDRQLDLYRAAADVLIFLRSAPCPDLPLCTADWLTEMLSPAFEWYAGGTNAMQTFEPLFRPFAERVAPAHPCMILRDYHAQNLLLLADRTGIAQVGLLDFQDAMLGHPAYDLVSILQDARRDVPPRIEQAIIRHVVAQTGEDPEAFKTAYAILGLQRNLRILGIFARLGLRDAKAHYIDLIPRVWGYVERNLDHPDLFALRSKLMQILPQPTPRFLEKMKARCPTPPTP